MTDSVTFTSVVFLATVAKLSAIRLVGLEIDADVVTFTGVKCVSDLLVAS